jgi:hypothetical protein
MQAGFRSRFATYRIGAGKAAKRKKDLGGAKGLIECRVARSKMSLWRRRSGGCPISAFSSFGIAGRRYLAIPPPNHYAGIFWARAVADQMQIESYGGLSVATKRRLREIADAVRNGDANAILGSTRIKPGTQMIRQWQNATHTVTTLEGFEWNGRTYSSLSAVTNAITGTKWNGFAFFGIKRAPSGNKNAAEPRRTNSHANPDLSTVPV